MTRSVPPSGDVAVSRELLRQHLRDAPDADHRQRLLARLQRRDEAPGHRDRLTAAVQPNGPTAAWRRRVLTPARRGIAVAGAMVAAACAVWLVWRSTPEPPPTVSKEPSPTRRVPGATTPRPCHAALGTDGTLWHSRLSSPHAPSIDGRSGVWLHSWGGSMPGDPRPAEIVPSADADGFLLRAAGPSASGWGAKLGVALRARPGSTLQSAKVECYDASAYDGIRFRASGSGIVFVLLQTPDSVPPELGGTCRDKCWFTASHAVALSEEPQDYLLEWSVFSREDDAQPIQSRLMFVELFFQKRNVPYEVAVQSVGLAKRREAAVP